jgi:hypothetical protein
VLKNVLLRAKMTERFSFPSRTIRNGEKTLSGYFYFSNHFSNADEPRRTVGNADERTSFRSRIYRTTTDAADRTQHP